MRLRACFLTTTSELENQMYRLQEAQKKGDPRSEALEGKQVSRLKKWENRYMGDMNRNNLLANVLDRYQGICSDTILEMDREISDRQREKDYSETSQSIVRSAMKILKGLPEKEMWDGGIEALENQYNAAIGEVGNELSL